MTILLVGFLSFVLLRRAILIIEDAKVFEIKVIESTTETRIDYTKKLSYLLGESIFNVNLKAAQGKLQAAYPQAAQIRIFRQLPNKIVIDFKERRPLARVSLNGKIAVVSSDGFIMAMTAIGETELPFIAGVSPSGKIAVGRKIDRKNLRVALEIIMLFEKTPSLKAQRIYKMDVSNLSKINLYLNEKLNAIIDQDDLGRQVNTLGIVLAKANLDLGEILYIDLRFKEPVIKKQ